MSNDKDRHDPQPDHGKVRPTARGGRTITVVRCRRTLRVRRFSGALRSSSS